MDSDGLGWTRIGCAVPAGLANRMSDPGPEPGPAAAAAADESAATTSHSRPGGPVALWGRTLGLLCPVSMELKNQ